MSETFRDGLVQEAERLEEDTLHSSKSHYAASERWRNVHLWVGVPTAALTAIAGLVIVAGPAEVRGASPCTPSSASSRSQARFRRRS